MTVTVQSAIRFGIHPPVPVEGRVVSVYVSNGPERQPVCVDVFRGPQALAPELRLEIPLDADGRGLCEWRVPGWDFVHFGLGGVRVSRAVMRRPTVARRFARLLSKASLALEFVDGGAGAEYGVGRRDRARLLRRIRRINRALHPLSTPRQHLRLAEEVLRIPPTIPGAVVECGCYGGGSTATLSLACAATGRELYVCDSFEGLPPNEHWNRLTDGSVTRWGTGELASPGSLEGVRWNVARHGDVSVCRFVPGFFDRTLPELPCREVAMVFEDADLVSSVQDCVRYLWPKLQPGCKFFSHEPWSVDIVAMFFDDAFWRESVGGPAPGFVGSGGAGTDGGRYQIPGLGYAVKDAG